MRELLVRIVVYYYTVFAKPSCGGWQAFRKVIYMALSALLELSEKEYDAFASVHPYANFLNSIYSGRKFALRGWDVHYVGIRRDGEIAAATLLVSVKLHGSYRYYYAPRGFLLDYADHELLQAMCQGVKQFARAQWAVSEDRSICALSGT